MVPHKVGRRQGWVLGSGEWRSGMCGSLRSLRTGQAGKGVWRGVGERGQKGWVRCVWRPDGGRRIEGDGTWGWPATMLCAFLANSQACLLLTLAFCFP